jgi:hypothetical protein
MASGYGYSRRFDEIVSHIPDKTKVTEDTFPWTDNLTCCFHQAVNWLDICGQHGINLNPDKFQFGKDSAEFAGFEITFAHANYTWTPSATSRRLETTQTYSKIVV